MQEREMLELAAKAAGRVVEAFSPSKGLLVSQGDGVSAWWDPLTTDGDALRLAVKLEIDIAFQRPGVEACRSHSHPSLPSFGSVRALEHDNDPCAATRRAIVRAAAEIGKAMP